jgi:thiol-disulfide isomerase/thioredoxin
MNLRYLRVAGGVTDAERASVIEKYKKLADAHPGDSDYAFLYATALVGVNTPDAIARLKTLSSGAPGYPLADVELSEIYSWGKFANHEEARAQLDAYFAACPASFNDRALGILGSSATPPMAAKYAPQLRERLTKDSDPDRVKIWETIWTLEFKAHPPSEHAEVRKQIAADLASLDRNPPTTDIHRLLILQAGYKMLDDETTLRHIEDRIVAAAPNGFTAKEILLERFFKEHPYPKPGDPKSAMQAFYRLQLQFADERLRESPGDSQYLENRFRALSELDDSTAKQIVGAANALRAALRKGTDSFYLPPLEFQIADTFLKRRTHVSEVPTLVADGLNSYRSPWGSLTSDRQTDESSKDAADLDFLMKSEEARILLDAAQQLKKPAIAKRAIDSLTDAKPGKPGQQSTLWFLRAKWAELNGRKLDALLMYRAALDARPASEKPDKDDELAASFAHLWSELGGTPDTQKLLAKVSGPIEATSEGRWEIPTKDLPAWQLSDLAGRTWTAASLHGKIVFINIWATWCGPCREEHSSLQALYEKIKDRSDVQILTFNIDDEVGDVAPYMTKNKYTFPVLLARNYVDDLLPLISIPRVWIVDASGKWRWEQIGFGDDAKWESEILEKLDHTKPQ